MRTVLSIAGSDSCGGAGIQADVKTLTMNNVFAMTAITALTAQNTQSVCGIYEVPPKFLEDQLNAVFQDIPPDAVKIGMVCGKELIETICGRLKFYSAKNVVVDPVMISSSGSPLIREEAAFALSHDLFPLAALVTPNIPEAEILWGKKIQSPRDMEEAAMRICETYRCAVLLKGGHRESGANDLLCREGKLDWIEGERIETKCVHGTGCTLSSAIAANLAKGYEMLTAVKRAKEFVFEAISARMQLGKGSLVLNHSFALNGHFAESFA